MHNAYDSTEDDYIVVEEHEVKNMKVSLNALYTVDHTVSFALPRILLHWLPLGYLSGTSITKRINLNPSMDK